MQNRFMDRFWDLPNASRFTLESTLSLYFNSRWCSNLTNARADKCPKSEANRCSFTRETIVQCEWSKTRSEGTPMRFTILLCEWVLTEKYIGDDLQPMRARYRAAGSSGRTFFYKAISHLQTMCVHFGIRIYRSGRLHEDEKGAIWWIL